MRRRLLCAVMMLSATAWAVAGCGLSPRASGSSGTQPSRSGASAATSPRPTQPVSARSLISPATGKYLGIEADGLPGSLTPLINLAAGLGQRPNLAGQYVAWGTPFDASGALKAWQYGALYYMAWEPFSTSAQAIAAGASDSYIRRFAQAVKGFGQPVAISFGHEMNGVWYPWGSQATPAADFVAAWRHIHNLFQAAGATNVIWVWNPNIINPLPQVQLRPYWPGNSYVDWVGITGYFGETGADSFNSVFGPTIREARQFTQKPFIIAETAVQSGPNAVTCARSLVHAIATKPDVLGFIWFDYDKDGVDWRIESRPEIRAVLAGSLAGVPLVRIGS